MQYPPRSAQAGEEGDVRVRLLISRDGSILDAVIVTKSGFINLDKEAKDVFRRIGKFPPVPANVSPGSEEFSFEYPVNFKLGE